MFRASVRHQVYILSMLRSLIESGDAYYCFCDKERLESLKTSVGEDGKEITVYDKHCLSFIKRRNPGKSCMQASLM